MPKSNGGRVRPPYKIFNQRPPMSTHREVNRRDLLKTVSAGAAAVAMSPWLNHTLRAADSAPGLKKKKILFFTKSSGFQHSTITRKPGEKLAFAERLLTDFGDANGFDVTCSKDGSLFTPEYLAQFDALAFYTTGDLTEKGGDGNPPMTKEGKAAFLNAIKHGKGRRPLSK